MSTGRSESRPEPRQAGEDMHGKEKNGLVFAAVRLRHCKADEVWSAREKQAIPGKPCKARWCAEARVSGHPARNSVRAVDKDGVALGCHSDGN